MEYSRERTLLGASFFFYGVIAYFVRILSSPHLILSVTRTCARLFVRKCVCKRSLWKTRLSMLVGLCFIYPPLLAKMAMVNKVGTRVSISDLARPKSEEGGAELHSGSETSCGGKRGEVCST